MRQVLLGFVLAGAAAGLAATAFWLFRGEAALTAVSAPVAVALVLAVAATSLVNLAIRWLRWHFLTRRVIRTLGTRTSLILYFGTLPAFATPLYVGELLRSSLAARRLPGAGRAVFSVWALERLADVSVLVVLLLAARGHWAGLGALGLVVGLGVWRIRRRATGRNARALSAPRVLAVVGGTSLVAWSLTVAGLWLITAGVGHPVGPARAADAFAVGSLLGGLSLLPAGTGVTGSSMIVALSAAMPAAAAVLSVALLRAATAWFALALGAIAFLRWRREIVAAARTPRSQEHFDELAAEYGDEIPAAVRERVVLRKVAVMTRWARSLGIAPGARGLDLGCGHGWYAAEMVRAGFAIRACDRSAAQVAQAERFVAAQGLAVDFAAADGTRLPYPDACFDFAYAVNVIHHVTDPAARARVFAEVVRVLRPGGSFFLQEINTENPAFAFYMGYVFPLLRRIDDGTEVWVKPSRLPDVPGAAWDPARVYLTFLPDFTPQPLLRLLAGLEAWLERSRVRRWSAHYVARLVREGAAPGQGVPGAGGNATSTSR